MEKVKVKEITIIRKEGSSHKCNIEHKFTSYKEANNFIIKNEDSYPDIGYDKHIFSICWEDGSNYSGRLDLKHPSNKHYSLDGNRIDSQVKNYLQWVVNKNDPVYKTDAQLMLTLLEI